jgi:hypothetical protein
MEEKSFDTLVGEHLSNTENHITELRNVRIDRGTVYACLYDTQGSLYISATLEYVLVEAQKRGYTIRNLADVVAKLLKVTNDYSLFDGIKSKIV